MLQSVETPGPMSPSAASSAGPARFWARIPAWVWPVGVAVVGLVMGALVWAIDPHRPGRWPPCPLYWLTGTYCPGCGSLRAINDLAHGRPAGLVDMNPALVLALPYLGGSWVAWTRRSLTGLPRRWLAPGWVIWLVFGAVVAYWVARNIPALAPWLAPGGVVAPAFD